jgi:hypothetical protein
MTRPPGIRRMHRPAADVEATTKAALRRGATIDQASAPQIASWRISGDCLTPIPQWDEGHGHWDNEAVPRDRRMPKGSAVWELAPRSSATHPVTGEVTTWVSSRTLQKLVRCRKCPNCLKAKRVVWTEKAVKEWKQASYLDAQGKPRGTWFGTLTLAPEHKLILLYRTRARLTAAGSDLESMSEADQFKEKGKEFFDEADKYFKRVRKGLRQKGDQVLSFRYLLVIERHKSGEPHMHFLCHETSALFPISKRRLEKHWPFGHTDFIIVKNERQCRYVAKYLGKEHNSRVHASLRYGKRVNRAKSVQEIAHDLLEKQSRIIKPDKVEIPE